MEQGLLLCAQALHIKVELILVRPLAARWRVVRVYQTGPVCGERVPPHKNTCTQKQTQFKSNSTKTKNDMRVCAHTFPQHTQVEYTCCTHWVHIECTLGTQRTMRMSAHWVHNEYTYRTHASQK